MFWFSCLMLHHLTIETFHVKCTEAHLTFVAKLKILPGGAKKMVEKTQSIWKLYVMTQCLICLVLTKHRLLDTAQFWVKKKQCISIFSSQESVEEKAILNCANKTVSWLLMLDNRILFCGKLILAAPFAFELNRVNQVELVLDNRFPSPSLHGFLFLISERKENLWVTRI